MLVGLAVTFAAVASLAAVAGGWAVEANRYGRVAALIRMTLFGPGMLLPELATVLTRPLVSLGGRLAETAGRAGGTAASSLLLGVATGLIWAPCAGPVLGVILTGAALSGPSLGTSLLLLTYGLGAALRAGRAAYPLSGRHRQRFRHLAGVRQPNLAGAVCHRRGWTGAPAGSG